MKNSSRKLLSNFFFFLTPLNDNFWFSCRGSLFLFFSLSLMLCGLHSTFLVCKMMRFVCSVEGFTAQQSCFFLFFYLDCTYYPAFSLNTTQAFQSN